MAITTDHHIHTHCSCDSACLEFETLVSDAKKIGLTDFGVTEHYHTRMEEADIAASRIEYEETLKKHPELLGHFHFGIEASVVSEWYIERVVNNANKGYGQPITTGIRERRAKNEPITFDFDEEFLEKYKIDFVVAGMHAPKCFDTDKESLVKEYHRQYMFAATHPATDILAHYLWWDESFFKRVWKMPDAVNPFLDMSIISETMRNELKAALKENNVAFELNLHLILSTKLPDSFKDEYLGFAADLQHSGIILSLGSDCHEPNLPYDGYDKADEMFKRYKINSSEFFRINNDD